MSDEQKLGEFLDRFTLLMSGYKFQSDTARIEMITSMFTKFLIGQRMHDLSSYLEVAHRAGILIETEIKWQTSYERSLAHAREERTIIDKTTEEILGEMRRAIRGPKESHA